MTLEEHAEAIRRAIQAAEDDGFAVESANLPGARLLIKGGPVEPLEVTGYVTNYDENGRKVKTPIFRRQEIELGTY